jgi:hypothetical protein
MARLQDRQWRDQKAIRDVVEANLTGRSLK